VWERGNNNLAIGWVVRAGDAGNLGEIAMADESMIEPPPPP
jgi:hypothetical protein